MKGRFFSKARADDGAAIVLIAVSMMLLIGIASLAVDLGALREDIRADRLAAYAHFEAWRRRRGDGDQEHPGGNLWDSGARFAHPEALEVDA